VEELTRRERIIKVLSETKHPLTVDEIARALGIDVRERRTIYEDLSHISKSIRRRSGGKLQLFMVPPQCANCGYVFKDIKRLKKPSKCPRCKSERILPPRFIIK